MSARGTLYGVGVGPGDPELVTLKALRVLRTCPVVAFPANPQGESMARTVVRPWLHAGKVEVPIGMDFVSAGRESALAAYDVAAETLDGHLRAGLDVAVLCEGDPLFFGSFIYLLERLGADHSVSVVPGITSVSACAAAAARPIVQGDEGLTVLPATLPDAELETRLSATEAAAVMKLGRHLPRVAAILDRLGRAEGAQVVVRAGHPDQAVLPLAEALAHGVPYFSLLLTRKPA